MIWLAAHGRVVDQQGKPSTSAAVAITTLLGLGELAACVYALRVPVLWVEIGPILRYATAMTVREVAWGDVQRIWIDREDWKAGVPPLVSVTLVKHFVLVIQINDYKDLRVLVPTASKNLIERIMQQHPRFKDSPFDDEPLPGDADDDDD
jgi:hypothetical protein